MKDETKKGLLGATLGALIAVGVTQGNLATNLKAVIAGDGECCNPQGEMTEEMIGQVN